MKQQTHEAHDSTEPTFVIDFIQSMMRTEITNPVSRRGNVLLVSLSDHSMARIVAPQVPRDTQPPVQTEARVHNLATWRYITEHDFGYGDEHFGEPLKKLELHNMDECRTYVEDAVITQFNAYFTNGLIEFLTTGEKFLVLIAEKTVNPSTKNKSRLFGIGRYFCVSATTTPKFRGQSTHFLL